jgi:hypothetical protein
MGLIIDRQSVDPDGGSVEKARIPDFSGAAV